MTILTEEERKTVSFPDVNVLEMKLDLQTRLLEIRTDSAYFERSGEGILANSCRVTASNWQSIRIRRYHSDSELWKDIDLDAPIEKIGEICEFSSDKDLCFASFGLETGLWIEFFFSEPVIKIEVD